MIQHFFPSKSFSLTDLLKDFPCYLLLNCLGKRTLKMKSSMRFNCTHSGSPRGAFSAFLEVAPRFSFASPRRVLQRSKGVCQPANLGYTEEMKSTNFPMCLTFCLVQKIWPTLESLKHAEHLQESWGLCCRTSLWREATRGLKVLKSDRPHTGRGSKCEKGFETVNTDSSKNQSLCFSHLPF